VPSSVPSSVTRHESYAPKHRAARPEPSPRRVLRRAGLLSGAAVAATGLAVSAGILSQGVAPAASASPPRTSPLVSGDVETPSTAKATAALLSDRSRQLSRSDRRTSVDATKKRALDQRSGGQVTGTEDLTTGDPRSIAKAMLPRFGFGADQYSCLDSIYVNESGWNVHADNPTSSAYGIPQALPGSKMASAGADWATNPATQIRWGLGYIKARYGTPCSAWGFKQGHGWY
jgi:hypothetical protein